MYFVFLQFISQFCISTLLPFFFFFNDTATTEIYTLSLHDALPIFERGGDRGILVGEDRRRVQRRVHGPGLADREDRKSTRLNSSHRCISYAVFCLKKKKKKKVDSKP